MLGFYMDAENPNKVSMLAQQAINLLIHLLVLLAALKMTHKCLIRVVEHSLTTAYPYKFWKQLVKFCIKKNC